MTNLNERIGHIRKAPHVRTAEINEGDLHLHLPSGARLSIAIRELKPLRDLPETEWSKLKCVDGGRILLWPASGVSIAVEGLLEFMTGLNHSNLDLAAAGKRGGAARTAAKIAAARANGAKGGRPRKVAADAA